jgi:hypothetical protein
LLVKVCKIWLQSVKIYLAFLDGGSIWNAPTIVALFFVVYSVFHFLITICPFIIGSLEWQAPFASCSCMYVPCLTSWNSWIHLTIYAVTNAGAQWAAGAYWFMHGPKPSFCIPFSFFWKHYHCPSFLNLSQPKKIFLQILSKLFNQNFSRNIFPKEDLKILITFVASHMKGYWTLVKIYDYLSKSIIS